MSSGFSSFFALESLLSVSTETYFLSQAGHSTSSSVQVFSWKRSLLPFFLNPLTFSALVHNVHIFYCFSIIARHAAPATCNIPIVCGLNEVRDASINLFFNSWNQLLPPLGRHDC